RHDPDVERFRLEELRSRLLEPEDVERWVQRQARRDGEPTNLITAALPAGTTVERGAIKPPLSKPTWSRTQSANRLRYAVPDKRWPRSIAVAAGGKLDRLRVLSVDLAAIFRWTQAQATTFVLTDGIPWVDDLRVTTELAIHPRAPGSVTARIHLTVDPAMGPAELAAHYAEARRAIVPGRYRPLSEKHLQLAVFAVTTQEEGWAEMMRAWNREHARKHGRYDNLATFKRDVRQAQRRILDPYDG